MPLTGRLGPRQGRPSVVRVVHDRGGCQQARDHLAELIDTTRRSGDPVFVTRRGRRVAVILDPDVYEQLIGDVVRLALDPAELRAARADDDYIP